MKREAIIFDLDGVLFETEEVWNDVRHEFAVAHGGHWGPEDQPMVMGASSMEWAAHMREHNGVQLADRQIYDGIVDGLRDRYAAHLPLIAGAGEAVRRLAGSYRLGVASSSPREIIECVLDLGGLLPCFMVIVSSDEVGRGKPAPDVYLEACARLGVTPRNTVAVEDSANGLRAAHGAGLMVVAIPNAVYPPADEAVALADVVLRSIEELDGALIESLDKKQEKDHG